MDGNTRKLNAVCGVRAPRYDKHTGALVATGGICLPTNVDYSVPTSGSADRPLRDALPAFQATRGGIQFVTPPDIGVPTLQGGTASGAGLATGIWTEATDANPAGATKPVWQVACGHARAGVRGRHPNPGSSSATCKLGSLPEQVAANTEQADRHGCPRGRAEPARQDVRGVERKSLAAQVPWRHEGPARQCRLLIAQRYRHSPPDIRRGSALTAVFPESARATCSEADMAREIARRQRRERERACHHRTRRSRTGSASAGSTWCWTMEGFRPGRYGTGGTQPSPRSTGRRQRPGQRAFSGRARRSNGALADRLAAVRRPGPSSSSTAGGSTWAWFATRSWTRTNDL